jgi:FKBP-type peptidyl-prolyl cis-trans isomerase SlyD
MTLEANKVVTISYIVTNSEGKVVDQAPATHPYSFLSGQNQILPKLEEKIAEMVIGSKKKVSLTPEEGYGEFQEQAVKQMKRSDFPTDMDLTVGRQYMADAGDGRHLPFYITAVSDDQITIDFNHPLAGKTLQFEVELLNIRDATDEELIHGHAHGTGGHHH